MDYKKKYENALEWARQVINGECGFIRKDVEEVFPELNESEDEKIRKDVLAFIRREGQHINKYKWHKWIAWLEKQGEQSSAKTCKDAWSEEDKNLLKKAIKLLDEFGGDRNAGAYTLQQMSCRYCADWLKSLKQRMQ